MLGRAVKKNEPKVKKNETPSAYNIREAGKRYFYLHVRGLRRGPHIACMAVAIRIVAASQNESVLQPQLCSPQQPCVRATAQAGVPSSQTPSCVPRLYYNYRYFLQWTGSRTRRRACQTMRTVMGEARDSRGSATQQTGEHLHPDLRQPTMTSLLSRQMEAATATGPRTY